MDPTVEERDARVEKEENDDSRWIPGGDEFFLSPSHYHSQTQKTIRTGSHWIGRTKLVSIMIQFTMNENIRTHIYIYTYQ